MNTFVNNHQMVIIMIEDPLIPDNMDAATYPKLMAHMDLRRINMQKTVVRLRSFNNKLTPKRKQTRNAQFKKEMLVEVGAALKRRHNVVGYKLDIITLQ